MVDRLELAVPADAAGERLDRFLGGLPELGSRSRAERLIAAGQVLVDGVAAPKSLQLSGGESILVETGEPRPAPRPAVVGFAVVHSDDDLIVVDKPPGIVVHPAPGVRGPTLVEGLAGLAGGGPPERPGIVHRLDKDTSGLMVVARNDEALRELSGQIRRREVGREYTALVEGALEARTGTIDAPIGRDRPGRRMAVEGAAARAARTHFEVVERLPEDTLVGVRLETGRTHQIRAHFAAIGHPVTGDPKYGPPSHRGRHGLARQFLHSGRLSFVHPRTGREMEFRSELPPDLTAALEQARAAGSS
jgi:23S rRNA pseudouridine1911/1915/1917 synthase